MMKIKPIIFLIFIAEVVFFSQSAAGSGAQFLKLGVGARELAMGSAASAVTNDLNAIYWNPAGLSGVTGSQAGLTHAEWMLDTRYDTAVFAHKTPKGTLGLSAAYLNHGRQQQRDENRHLTGDFSASDMALSAAFSPALAGPFQTGLAMKFLESRIGADTARTMAFDFGAQFEWNQQYPSRLGLSVRNVGPKLQFIHQADALPLVTSVGISRLFFGGFIGTAEYQLEPRAGQQRFVLGSEFQVVSLISLRGGYSALLASHQHHRADFEKFSGFVGGLGLQWKSLSFDAAFEPFGELGDTHRFSLTTRF